MAGDNDLPERVPVVVRSVRRRSDAVIARRRALVGGDQRPPRGPQRLGDVERAAIASPTLLGGCGCRIPSFGATAIEQDLSVPADFLEALQDILEHRELRGDDDEIESVQSSTQYRRSRAVMYRRRACRRSASSRTSMTALVANQPAWARIIGSRLLWQDTSLLAGCTRRCVTAQTLSHSTPPVPTRKRKTDRTANDPRRYSPSAERRSAVGTPSVSHPRSA